MRHLINFNTFNINESDEFFRNNTNVSFDFIPFDDQVNNPKNSSIPTDITFNELLEVSKSMGTDIFPIGLYISHKKLSGGGFLRIIASNMDPLSFDLAIFDKDFKKTSEHKNIFSDNIDLDSYIVGSNVMNRFK